MKCTICDCELPESAARAICTSCLNAGFLEKLRNFGRLFMRFYRDVRDDKTRE